jgi:Mrp family chromosome partitioning ATPase
MPEPVAEDLDPSRSSSLTLMSPLERRRAAADRMAAPEVGRLRLLPTEEAPLDSTDVTVGNEFRRILDQLEADSDLVIIDAPPLGTSVTLWLGSLVDGVLVVANGQLLREAMLDELVHSLDELPGEKLGLVLTAVTWYPRRGYGYRRPPRPQHETVEGTPRIASSDRSR